MEFKDLIFKIQNLKIKFCILDCFVSRSDAKRVHSTLSTNIGQVFAPCP